MNIIECLWILVGTIFRIIYVNVYHNQVQYKDNYAEKYNKDWV